MEPVTFDELPLHDAVLHDVSVDWRNRVCRMTVAAFLHPSARAVPCTIVWRSVREIHIPIRQAWGPSAFVNSQKTLAGGRYTIEMQSGDTLVVEAEVVEFDGPLGAAA